MATAVGIRSINDILTAARTGQRLRLIVAGAAERSVIQGAAQAMRDGIVDVTLVGPEQAVLRAAEEACCDLAGIDVVHARDDDATISKAFMRLRDGRADLLMKGTVATDQLMRRGVLAREYSLRTGRILSHVTAYECPLQKRLVLLTDAGVNVEPDLGRKVDIIRNAAEVARTLGYETPRVALLAATEKADNTWVPAVRDANLLVEMAKAGQIPGCQISGPLSLDLAVSPSAGQRKKKTDDPVVGNADILVAHNIDVGNVLYKALQTWLGATLAALVIGARVPVIVPSRSDSEASRLASIALAVLVHRKAAMR